MLSAFDRHNLYQVSVAQFQQNDPQLSALAKLKYQYSPDWWKALSLQEPGIYILTGGRQVGKSTSCKLLILHCLKAKLFQQENILYLPCDEIYDAKQLSQILHFFLDKVGHSKFLLIIDEITFVKEWDRVIKALADEGWFSKGLCLLTGSDTLILKKAAMRFPGRRGMTDQVDFHLYPLSFSEYVKLTHPKLLNPTIEKLQSLFESFLKSGGYLRAINDVAEYGEIKQATYQTYEQWIRGDFLKQGKNEAYLLAVLQALFTVGVSQISYTALTQKIGMMSKDTCIEYCHMLARMDILISLQAFDQNKKQGFPKKAIKFHFFDPFIYRTIYHWLQREGFSNTPEFDSTLVEAAVASHCYRQAKTFYFKGQGEVDVIWLPNNNVQAIEVKWRSQLRPTDLKTLKQFKDNLILVRQPHEGLLEDIPVRAVYKFLYEHL